MFEYKSVINFIHLCVRILKIEFIFIRLRYSIPFLAKFIPPFNQYPRSIFKNVIRDNVNFQVYPSDFQQWYVFANDKDFIWRRALKYVTPSTSVLDIGSNIGSFSLKVAAHFSVKNESISIIAFEPNPYLQDLFYKNIQLNPIFKNNIHLIPKALGSKNEMVDFSYSKHHSGLGKMNTVQEVKIQVECSTLDKWFETNSQKISFIKIDVEGFELNVLRGAINVLKATKPTLYIEITPVWLSEQGQNEEDIWELLLQLNYSLWIDFETNLISLDEFKLIKNRTFYQYELVALPLIY